jgi:hypothetical protein
MNRRFMLLLVTLIIFNANADKYFKDKKSGARVCLFLLKKQ